LKVAEFAKVGDVCAGVVNDEDAVASVIRRVNVVVLGPSVVQDFFSRMVSLFTKLGILKELFCLKGNDGLHTILMNHWTLGFGTAAMSRHSSENSLLRSTSLGSSSALTINGAIEPSWKIQIE
jgi:hypothetical protein